MSGSDLKEAIEEIPEKSKALFRRIKNDWDTLSTAEKAGMIALAIITHPVVAGVAIDYIARKKLKKVV